MGNDQLESLASAGSPAPLGPLEIVGSEQLLVQAAVDDLDGLAEDPVPLILDVSATGLVPFHSGVSASFQVVRF